MADIPTDRDLARASAELHDLLVRNPGVDEFLRDVTELVASAVPGSSVGITMQRGRDAADAATIATSDEFALSADELQYTSGEGPCLESLRTGETFDVSDIAVDPRWPLYGKHAAAAGVGSSLSLPIVVDRTPVAAVNIYNRQRGAYGPGRAQRTKAFAKQIANALTVVIRSAEKSAVEQQLRDALVVRAVIDQAIGIVMAQQKLNALDAFDVLRTASQRSNRKLKDLAVELIESVTGEPPTPPRPFIPPR